MCGRYTLSTPGEVIAELFDLPESPRLAPRWNIAPTQPVAVVRTAGTGGRELAALDWG
jgi:putative SOS response-associated peptidase YedK